MPSPKPSCFAGRRGTPARLPILASELVGLGAHEPDVLDRFEDKR